MEEVELQLGTLLLPGERVSHGCAHFPRRARTLLLASKFKSTFGRRSAVLEPIRAGGLKVGQAIARHTEMVKYW